MHLTSDGHTHFMIGFVRIAYGVGSRRGVGREVAGLIRSKASRKQVNCKVELSGRAKRGVMKSKDYASELLSFRCCSI